jgi:hypothetical protein
MDREQANEFLECLSAFGSGRVEDQNEQISDLGVLPEQKINDVIGGRSRRRRRVHLTPFTEFRRSSPLPGTKVPTR